ncbi:disease resistance protein RGA2-like [Coffea eugenioides]|uniref:disease resistance protein RGA2-like n=1 Tax=Coffea eugenioides TaxID=49369 RepID=UPI000F6143E8|nr:disease resistance protein RGA2-like [Coffea eugenioides]
MEAFVGILVDTLNSMIEKELRLLCGIATDMQKLSSLLSTTKAVLEDAEQKQFTERAIQLWFQKLNGVAYEIDDKRGSYFNASRETGSVVNEPEVLGRDDEKRQIVRILTEEIIGDDQNVSVLPIVGVGGLGKTTLARLVFNDKRVIEHFEPKLWAWVSEEFDVKRIIKALIESVDKTSIGDLPLDVLQGKLQELLRGKRYLIVLDDVWNENSQKWEELKSVLQCGSKGSSIVTTTRMEMVAEIMRTLGTHRLSSLSDDQCWSLFRQRAFGSQEAEEYPNLIAIGKEIVKKCGGVPLAAKALGGFLRFKLEAEWNSVKCSEIWNLPEDETGILPALRLSYLNLPVELRGCFAYCAVFPKGSVIQKEEVIQLWMANGLISSNETMEVEDVGDAVVTELHHRSLFQAVDIHFSGYGDVPAFKMHDLVHDLARSVMKAKHDGTESNRTMMLGEPYHQLTVAFPIKITGTDQFSSFLSKCGSLRALIVRSMESTQEEFTQLSHAISNLKHLRHLNLSRCGIVELPNSICDLSNLQILNLNGCYKLRSLPKGMRFLRNLQHLCLKGCESLTHMPSEIGELTCLRTLSLVILSGKKDFQLCELGDLNMLRGELTIEHLERIEDKKDAEAACLIKKQSLRELYLVWHSERTLQRYNDEEVLEALKPCPNLQSLHVEGFKGSSLFPSWISTITAVDVVESAAEYIVGAQDSTAAAAAMSPSLKHLGLSDMPNLKGMLGREVQEEMLQNLSLLESLDIGYMNDLRALPRSLASLTALKELTIEECPKLKSLPEEGLRGLASLQELYIEGCYNLVSLSMGTKALKSLTHLSIQGSNATALPEEVKYFPALQELELNELDNLTSLPDWFGGGHLTSLQHLTLGSCPKLERLPSSIQMMKTLQSLSIGDCDLLEPRCEEGGEEEKFLSL